MYFSPFVFKANAKSIGNKKFHFCFHVLNHLCHQRLILCTFLEIVTKTMSQCVRRQGRGWVTKVVCPKTVLKLLCHRHKYCNVHMRCNCKRRFDFWKVHQCYQHFIAIHPRVVELLVTSGWHRDDQRSVATVMYTFVTIQLIFKEILHTRNFFWLFFSAVLGMTIWFLPFYLTTIVT